MLYGKLLLEERYPKPFLFLVLVMEMVLFYNAMVLFFRLGADAEVERRHLGPQLLVWCK